MSARKVLFEGGFSRFETSPEAAYEDLGEKSPYLSGLV